MLDLPLADHTRRILNTIQRVKWIRVAQMGLAWATGASRVSYAPKDVSIEPTNLCNYRCSFCPQSDPAHRELPSGYMALDQLDEILDKLVAAGAAWHNVINYTHDGEPFVHPEFPEFVRRATERGFRVRFSSNGSKFTKDKLDRLVDIGAAFRVRIDFSGSKEAFEQYRSKRNDWEKVRDNIANLIRASNEYAGIRVILQDISSYANPEEASENLDRMKAVLPTPTHDRVRFETCNFHNAAGLVQLQHPNPTGETYHQCPYPWVSLNIAWNGDIHACPRDLRGQTKLGNILEVDHLDEIWNGEAYQQFRALHANRDVDQLSACAGCDLPWREDEQRWSLKRIFFRVSDP